MIVYLIVWAVCIYAAHEIGKPKGRIGWIWGFLFGIFGVILVALLPATEEAKRHGNV